MYTSKLRNVGGSSMCTIPKSLIKTLGLQSDSILTLEIEDGRLILSPQKKPHYTLDDLLAQCDTTQPRAAEEQDWLDNAPTGREVL